MTTRIIICRHGNTFDKGDVVTRVGGRTDLALSTSGQAQAERLRGVFHPNNSPYNFTRAFSSNLRRTRETGLKVLENAHPARLLTRDFLKEIDYGIDENRPETEVVERLGQDVLNDWDQKAIVPDGWDVNPKQIRADWRKFLIEMVQSPGDVLVVTSNGIARFCLNAVDAITCAEPPLKLATAAYGIIVCENEKIILQSWNLRPPEL